MPEFLDEFARYVSSFMDSCVALAALRGGTLRGGRCRVGCAVRTKYRR
jgi:hypothetical protein